MELAHQEPLLQTNTTHGQQILYPLCQVTPGPDAISDATHLDCEEKALDCWTLVQSPL